MPDEKTTITEVVTGLGLTGAPSLGAALAGPPRAVSGVDGASWAQLIEAWHAGRHAALFAAAWENGRAFLTAVDGLRGRVPRTVEWKGPHKPPGYESLPADLRVDHVYLVSCKYGSDISTNSSPSNLFERLLADRRRGAEAWYERVAPEAYQAFYAEVRAALGSDLPPSVRALRDEDLALIRAACARRWPGDLSSAWRTFSFEVAAASSSIWRRNLSSSAAREVMLWRLLRLETSPYFVLGTSRSGRPNRYRVGTPWDWRQLYQLRDLTITAVPAGQPVVRWDAAVQDIAGGRPVHVHGDVEVRWSHGRFSAVEAKLHLTTSPDDVPGYFALR